MTKKKLIESFAQAIATMEGFYSRSPTRARANNNPGNLRSWGDVPITAGYAHFSTADAGWEALRRQVTKNLFERRLTIGEFFAGKPNVYPGYAPSADRNNPGHYANFVCHFLNPKFPDDQPFYPGTVLANLPFEEIPVSSQVRNLAALIVENEHSATAPAPASPTTSHQPR